MNRPIQSDLRAILSALGAEAASALPILDLVLSGIEDGIAITGAAGGALYCNAGARRILGLAAGGGAPDLQAFGAYLYHLHDFEPIPEDERPLTRALRGEHLDDAEFFVRNASLPEGALVRLDARPLREADGRVAGAIAILRDVGARKRAEEELQTANTKLGAWVAELERRATITMLTNEMADLLQSCRSLKEFYQVVASFSGRIFERDAGAMFVVNASRSALEMVASWGRDATPERIFAPDACWALRRGRPHDAGGGSLAPDCEHASSAGSPGYVCVPMMGQGEALGILHVQKHTHESGPGSELSAAITESRTRTILAAAEHIALALANLKLRESLSVQAIRDPLTGLFNRRYMEESLEREIARAARSGSAVTAVMIDIDHFKRFNDTFGHAAADLALRETASTIKASLRAEDIACRFGGEEIVLILPDTQLDEGAIHADRIRVAVEGQQLRYHGTPLGAITASFGVAASPGHGSTAELLLRAADDALYQAKAEGRNRTVTRAPATSGSRTAPSPRTATARPPASIHGGGASRVPNAASIMSSPARNDR